MFVMLWELPGNKVIRDISRGEIFLTQHHNNLKNAGTVYRIAPAFAICLLFS